MTANVSVLGAGCGGIKEMQQYLHNDVAQGAVVSYKVGLGTLARTHVLFLHDHRDACRDMQQMKLRERTDELKLSLSSAASEAVPMDLELNLREEITVEQIYSRVSEQHEEFSRPQLVECYESMVLSDMSWSKNTSQCCCPRHKSTKDFVTGHDALNAVIQTRGAWNWVLLEAVEAGQTMTLVAGGAGSVQEMQEFIGKSTDQVMFGLLRMSFGVGRFRRTHFVVVYASGCDVPPNERAQALRLCRKMKKPCDKAYAFSPVEMEVTEADDLTAEKVVEEVRKACIVEGEADVGGDAAGKVTISLESYLEALKENEEWFEDVCNKVSAFDALSVLTTTFGQWNWVFLDPVEAWQEMTVVDVGASSVQGMQDFIGKSKDKVMFGLLRMPFGVGQFRRTHIVVVYASGRDVPPNARSQALRLCRKMKASVDKAYVFSPIEMEVTEAGDFTVVNVVEEVRKACVVDGEADVNGDSTGKLVVCLESYQAALKEDEERRLRGPACWWESVSVEEMVKLVHSEGPPNWILLGGEALPVPSPIARVVPEDAGGAGYSARL